MSTQQDAETAQHAETRRLLTYGPHVTDVRAAMSMVFGVLADLAWPILDAYRSDLYWDAMWLNTNVPADADEFAFLFSVDESGTSISHADNPSGTTHRANVYRFRIVRDGRALHLYTTKISSGS